MRSSRWDDQTIVRIGLLYFKSGSYPGGTVWKVDKEGAEKGTSQLPHLHAWSIVIGQYLNLAQGNGLALGGGGQRLGGCLQNKLHSRLKYSKLNQISKTILVSVSLCLYDKVDNNFQRNVERAPPSFPQ